MHKLKFYSQVDQLVSFSVHRYHPKHYHGVCSEGLDDFDTEVLIETEFEPGMLRGYPRGGYHEDLVEVPAGEYFLNVYTHFSEGELMPLDWAITAWAEKDKLKIWNTSGRESNQWRVMKSVQNESDTEFDFDDKDAKDGENWILEGVDDL